MYLRSLGVFFVAAVLGGCAHRPGLKLVDVRDADRARWAKPRESVEAGKPFLAHLAGYGGRKVQLELWRGRDLIGKRSIYIPARKTYRSHDGWVFDTRFNEEPISIAERETIYWTSTDRVLQLNPLPAGDYELRLQSDDGRNESVKFTVDGP